MTEIVINLTFIKRTKAPAQGRRKAYAKSIVLRATTSLSQMYLNAPRPTVLTASKTLQLQIVHRRRLHQLDNTKLSRSWQRQQKRSAANTCPRTHAATAPLSLCTQSVSLTNHFMFNFQWDLYISDE